MADLIAIGYPDETTAMAAADEARRLARDLIIQPDAIAVTSGTRTAAITSIPTGEVRPVSPTSPSHMRTSDSPHWGGRWSAAPASPHRAGLG